MTSAKRKNTKIRRLVKSGECVACGTPPGNPANPVDPCHIRSFKVSQCDEPWNLISLCRAHHCVQHKYGWMYLMVIYSELRRQIENKGWEFTKLPDGSWKMANQNEVELNERRRGIG